MPTYIESAYIAEDLSPKKPLVLLFVASMSHGPGFSERIEYRLGPDTDNEFDVLWQKTDWDNEKQYRALAWKPRSRGRIHKRAIALLTELWTVEKSVNDWDRSPIDDITDQRGARLKRSEVWDVESQVWPD